MRWLAVLGVAFFIGLGACKEEEQRPAPAESGGGGPSPGGGGGSSREGGVDDGGAEGGDGGTCNDVLLPSAVIDRIAVNGDPPVATGGAIAEGTYDLTQLDVYVGIGGLPGPTGIAAQSAIVVTGTTIDQVIRYSGNAAPEELRVTYAYATSSATLSLTGVCPLGGAASRQYSSNGFTLVITDTASKEVFTFTKR
ncbi:MAG: hypothetical protein KF819_33625 [Labilithrix sp.]|nr:hypothetical protein [Labilithrix sp.]